MAEKFNPYRAGQPLSGTGNPNTGVWQRTWEDGGPGRPSFGGPKTPDGVADWSGDPWKPEAPGMSRGLAKAINNPEAIRNALVYGAVYGVGNKGEEGEPDGPGLPPPNTQKSSKKPLALGPGTAIEATKATPELEAAKTPPELEAAKTPLALNPPQKGGSNGTATFKKKAGNAHLNTIPQRRPNRSTTIKKADANSIANQNKDAIDVPFTDVTTAPQSQLPDGNVGEGLTGPQMAFQQTVNRSREHAQRYDQLRTHDVPSHESIQQGVKDSRRWHEDAAQGAKSTSAPKSGKRTQAGANLGAFYNLQEDRKNNVQ